MTRQALVFVSETSRFLSAQGVQATIAQVGNSATREATPGIGLWSAGWHGVRGLVSAARLELADAGIKVGVAAVIGPIRSPKTEQMVANLPPEIVNDQADVAAKIAAYAVEDELAAELVVTPS